MSPEPVEFAAKGLVGWLGCLGSLLFVALGLFLLFAPGLQREARWTGLGDAAFFGWCGAVYLRDLRRPRVALLLDAFGLEYRHPDPRQAFRSGWKTLAGVRVEGHERGEVVVLRLHDPARLPAAAPDWALAKGAWPPLVPPETSLSPAALGVPAAEMADTIERFRRYYGEAGLAGSGAR